MIQKPATPDGLAGDPKADPNHVLQQQQKAAMVPLSGGDPVPPALPGLRPAPDAPATPHLTTSAQKPTLAIPDYTPMGEVPGGPPNDPMNPPAPLQLVTTPTPSPTPASRGLTQQIASGATGAATDTNVGLGLGDAKPLTMDPPLPPPPPTTNGASSAAATSGATDVPSTLSSATPLPTAPLTPIDPTNSLIGQQINPVADDRLKALQGQVDSAASTLGGVDRTKLAADMFDTFAKSTDPAYQAALREATRRGAGAGQIGSGMLRTSYGDLANQRNQQLQTEQDTLMQNALNGTIQDKLNNLNALSGLEGQQFGEQTTNNQQLDQQQQFQNELEQQAIQQAIAQYQLQNEAQQTQFNQGLALSQYADQSNPATYYAALASQLGVDPSALSALAGQLGAKAAQSRGTSGAADPLAGVDVDALLKGLGGNLPGVSVTPNGSAVTLPKITGSPSVVPLSL